MRGLEPSQQQLFSYINLEERIPANHSLRPLKVLMDSILKGMDQQFEAVYSQEGRPSIPPERLLRASLLLRSAQSGNWLSTLNTTCCTGGLLDWI